MKKYHWLFCQKKFNSKQILQCLIQMLQVLMLGFEFRWNMLHILSNIRNIFKKLVKTFISFFYKEWCLHPSSGSHNTIKGTLGFGLKWCHKKVHEKCVSVLLLLPRHNFWKSVGCKVWSTFFSHLNSQNNGGDTLHIPLKFSKKWDTTLHPCNTPNKGGYTIKHSHGTPYFRSGCKLV